MRLRYAWPQYREEWTLALEVTEVHGATEPADVDAVARRVRLDASGAWSAVTLSFTVSTTEKAPDGLGATEAFVLLSSSRTNTRIPIKLEFGDGVYTGAATVDRANLGGAVEVGGQVVTVEPVLRHGRS
jgi:hypothetical protein